MPAVRVLLANLLTGRSGPASLKVLLTNTLVSGRTGTEIVTRNTALHLLQRGHKPIVYTQQAGPLAEELRRASVPVVTDIDALRVVPTSFTATITRRSQPQLRAFPQCRPFSSATTFSWQDEPVQFPSIRRYVAVDNTVADRLCVESGIAPERVAVELNSVDTQRFRPREQPLPKRPARALAYVETPGCTSALSEACERRGIALDIAGSIVGKQLDDPERHLPEYDIVFTSALSALEAMACGAAVVVCDARGLAGMVTPERFTQWRGANFGVRTLTREVNAENIAAEIDAYDPQAAARVTELVRKLARFDDSMDRYIDLYRACILERFVGDRVEHDRAMARHLQRWGLRYGPEWPWRLERARILNDMERAVRKPPRLRPGDDVRLEPEGLHYVNFIRGFSYPEPWGVWTEGDEALALFRVDERDRTVEIGVLVDGYVQPGREHLDVRVTANDAVSATWSFSYPSEPGWQRLRVPVARSGTVLLSFHIPDARVPLEEGGADTRRLGLALHGIAFYGASEDSTGFGVQRQGA